MLQSTHQIIGRKMFDTGDYKYMAREKAQMLSRQHTRTHKMQSNFTGINSKLGTAHGMYFSCHHQPLHQRISLPYHDTPFGKKAEDWNGWLQISLKLHNACSAVFLEPPKLPVVREELLHHPVMLSFPDEYDRVHWKKARDFCYSKNFD